MATMDVELFECERYRLMAGWSSDYLLVTDKAKYRLRNCATKSWKTFEDANSALLTAGWAWEQMQDDQGSPMSWTVDLQASDVDAEGWSYAATFSKEFQGGSSKATLQKVVRWRRLVRTQTFSSTEALEACMTASATAAGSNQGTGKEPLKGEGSTDAPSTDVCLHVDLAGGAYIQRLLPEAIAQASVYASEWSLHSFLLLKAQLLERLAGKPVNQKEATLDAVLAGFVNAQRSMSTRMSEAFSRKSHDDAAVAKRLREAEAWFPKAEIEAFTVLAIRRFRPDLACGCRGGSCGWREGTCPFRTVACENPGCQAHCCAKDMATHDLVCPQKLFSCEKCAEMVPRGELKAHTLYACPAREAKCHFSICGCEVHLEARNVEAHLEECTQAHLMLLMRELIKQQENAKSSQDRIADLEAQCTQAKTEKEALQQKCNAMETNVASLETKVGTFEKTIADGLKKVAGPVEDLKKSVASNKDVATKRMDASEKEAKKKFDSMEKCNKAELQALRTEMAALKDSTGDISLLRSTIDALKGGVRDLEVKVCSTSTSLSAAVAPMVSPAAPKAIASKVES